MARNCRLAMVLLASVACFHTAAPLAIGKAVDSEEAKAPAASAPSGKVRISTASCFLELASPQTVHSQKQIDENVLKNPSSVQAHVVRGYALLLDGDIEEAGPEFDRALALDPHSPKAHVGRSRIFQAKSEYRKAMGELDKAAEFANAEEKRRIDWEAAFISREHRQYPTAISRFNSVLKCKFPSEQMHAFALLMRAETYSRTAIDDKALEDLSASMKLDPYSIAAYVCRGELLERHRKFKEALADYNRAIKNGVFNEPLYKTIGITPVLANAYKDRARVETTLGMKDMAQQDLQKVQLQQHEYMDYAPFSTH